MSERTHIKYVYFYSKETLIQSGAQIVLYEHKLRQIFRHIAMKFRRHTGVCQEISMRYDGKYTHRVQVQARCVPNRRRD